MNSKKIFKLAGIIGVIVIVGVGMGTFAHMYKTVSSFNKVFSQNVYIEDLPVGGLTKEEARQELDKAIETTINNEKLIVYYGDTEQSISYSNLGITYNIDQTIDEAFTIGHEGDIFSSYKIAKNGLSSPSKFYITTEIKDDELLKFVKDSAQSFLVKAIDSSMVRSNGTFVIKEGTEGRILDEEKTLDSIKEQLETYDGKTVRIEATMKITKPNVTTDMLKNSQNLIASFSTSYNNASANRNENLKVAAKKISKTLSPDEIFYLSNQLEPFTVAAGYKNAGVIVNGKIEDGLGGGVCQVASTLYNALLLTDIEIVSRQNHSLPVSYVPLGRDATYATDIVDFKFKNNTGYPLTVEAYCKDNNVYVDIYGHKDFIPKYDIKFESIVTEVIPAPETKYKIDPSLPDGKQVVEVRALDGKRVKLYKVYYENGKVVNKEVVNTSYYRPRAAVVKVNKDPKTMSSPTPTPSVSSSPVETSAPVVTPTTSPEATQTPQPTTSPEATSLPEQEDVAEPTPSPVPQQTSDVVDTSDNIEDDSFLQVQE